MFQNQVLIESQRNNSKNKTMNKSNVKGIHYKSVPCVRHL